MEVLRDTQRRFEGTFFRLPVSLPDEALCSPDHATDGITRASMKCRVRFGKILSRCMDKPPILIFKIMLLFKVGLPLYKTLPEETFLNLF